MRVTKELRIIEDADLTVSLYNKFKRAGINFVSDIHKFDKRKLTKQDLIELLEKFAEYK